jgi:magnesium-transporting ATPase (P-type)
MSENYNEHEGSQDEPLQEELGFSDKLVGVLSSPAETFSSVAAFPLKTIDWLLPFCLLLILIIASNFVKTSNPAIASEIQDQQRQRVYKMLEEQQKEGKLTKEQVNEQKEKLDDQLKGMNSPIFVVIQSVSIFVGAFLIFFIICGIYFLIAKFGFKDDATYQGTMVANGLVAVISMIQVLITTILSMAMNKFIPDTSINSFVSIERTSPLYFAGIIDPFKIWSYAVIAIAMSKLFKAGDAKKYYFMVFGIWLGWEVLFFILRKFVPFLAAM